MYATHTFYYVFFKMMSAPVPVLIPKQIFTQSCCDAISHSLFYSFWLHSFAWNYIRVNVILVNEREAFISQKLVPVHKIVYNDRLLHIPIQRFIHTWIDGCDAFLSRLSFLDSHDMMMALWLNSLKYYTMRSCDAWYTNTWQDEWESVVNDVWRWW